LFYEEEQCCLVCGGGSGCRWRYVMRSRLANCSFYRMLEVRVNQSDCSESEVREFNVQSL
jgi:hypothetical protein